MKVNVTKAGHFAKIKGKIVEIETGLQDLETAIAKSMIDNGYAVDVKAKSSDKQAEQK